MTRPLLAASACAVLGLAACADGAPDVVESAAPTSPTATAAPVSDTRADTATTSAAVALGMTRDDLEDADLLSPDNTDLGDVETLVLNTGGQVTSLVIGLEGQGDRKVVVPIGQVTSVRRGDDVDLSTTLTAAQLAALPAWDPSAPR